LRGDLLEKRLSAGFQLAAQNSDLSFEFALVVGVLEDLPCPKQSLADMQPELSELFLVREAFGVRGEVSAAGAPSRPAGAPRADGYRPTSGLR
jgi:hypothetical protein